MRDTKLAPQIWHFAGLTLGAALIATSISFACDRVGSSEARLSVNDQRSKDQPSLLGASPPTQLITNPEDMPGAEDDRFGWAVAADGEWMIVGAPSDDTNAGTEAGSAYFFRWTGVSWTLEQSVRPDDAEASAWFGYSVSIDGDTAIVGSIFKDGLAGSNTGAAYVYIRSEGSWNMQQKLVSSDPDISDEFGHSVALSNDLAVVGAIGDRTVGTVQLGAAYIFARSNGLWTQQQKLVSQDRDSGDLFGWSVATSQDVVVVGAPQDDGMAGDAGAAYIFKRNSVDWIETQKLVASDTLGGDKFGVSTAISGPTLLVGAYGDDNAGGIDAGAAYLFDLTGQEAQQLEKLLEPGASHRGGFGYSVSMLTDQALIGAPLSTVDGMTSAGFARVFVLDNGSWRPDDRFELEVPSQDDLLGHSVALSSQAVAVGAYFDDSGISGRQDVGSVLMGSNPKVFSDGFEGR
jgi:hypothetical protein